MRKCIFYFILTILFNCSSTKNTINNSSVKTRSVWFDAPRRFTDIDIDGNNNTHPFFDLNSFFDNKSKFINYFNITPVGSSYMYGLDMISGRKYRKYELCSQYDIWKNYKEPIFHPPFSLGVIPRLLNTKGDPQDIWVFGSDKYLVNSKDNIDYADRAKIIGSVLLQYCDNYPCRGKDQWDSRLIIIAVNKQDPMYSSVNSIKDLRQVINWKKIKAFADNAFGRLIIKSKEFPSQRMIGTIGLNKTIGYLKSNAKKFKFKEINLMRKACFTLYDNIWHNVDKISKGKFIKVKESYSLINLKKKFSKENYEFNEYFTFFYNNFKKQYNTCRKYVKSNSFSNNQRRSRFFSYIDNFFQLEELGYQYSCIKREWYEGSEGYKITKQKCDNKSLDIAFNKGVRIMQNLKSSSKDYYRFIDYDHGAGGTQNKLYSWVKESGKKLSCIGHKSKRLNIRIMPKDIKWLKFDSSNKNKNIIK